MLDEADEMLDMGFREDLEEILDATPPARRTLLFSATMPRPIVALAKRYQKDALRISTVGEERGHGDIAYQAMTVAPADIEHAVVNLLRLHEAESALLFCATRENVRRLHSSLVERGFSAVALSGEHSQNERNQALQALRDGRARVLVATDVAARGIDLPNLSLVVHVELPRDAETLQHRSGRTGRAGKKGIAVLVVPYPRRKRVESVLRGARIEVEWIKPPTPEDIRRSDHERLLAALLEPAEIEEEDRDARRAGCSRPSRPRRSPRLWSGRTARGMPAPEELVDAGAAGEPRRPDGPAPGLRGHDLVPHGHRPPPQCRSALAPALALPPRPHHQVRDRRDPHRRRRDDVRSAARGGRPLHAAVQADRDRRGRRGRRPDRAGRGQAARRGAAEPADAGRRRRSATRRSRRGGPDFGAIRRPAFRIADRSEWPEARRSLPGYGRRRTSLSACRTPPAERAPGNSLPPARPEARAGEPALGLEVPVPGSGPLLAVRRKFSSRRSAAISSIAMVSKARKAMGGMSIPPLALARVEPAPEAELGAEGLEGHHGPHHQAQHRNPRHLEIPSSLPAGLCPAPLQGI